MRTLIFLPLHILNHLLCLIMPKSKDIWLFGEWFGMKFGDNSAYAFNVRSSSVRKIWITKSREVLDQVRSQGGECYLAYSAYGLYIQARAKVFVCTVNARDFCYSSLTRRNLIVQLWHGLPLKKIGFDVLNKSRLKRVIASIRAKTTDRYSYVVSPSPSFDDIFCSAFKLPMERLLRSLYPRCDGLFVSPDERAKIKSKLGVTTKFLIFYLPTHRDEGRKPWLIRGFVEQMKSLDPRLSALDVTLIVKPHFYERANISGESFGNVRICQDLDMDLYRSLSVADAIITDYSSIAIDFRCTKRPVFYYVPDLEEYVRLDRDCYFDLARLLVGGTKTIESLGEGIEAFIARGVSPIDIALSVPQKDTEISISETFQELLEAKVYGKAH